MTVPLLVLWIFAGPRRPGWSAGAGPRTASLGMFLFELVKQVLESACSLVKTRPAD
jgi:hypothetical protein